MGAYLHNLPYKIIPCIMLRYLAMVSTHQLNLFPVKGGVSAYLSPHMIMTGRNLDFDKHCQNPFGAYVQANQENDPTNTQAPRTIDAVYLHPMTNKQGGHEMMNLNRLLKYINGSRQDKLTLSANNLHVIKWYVDCAFAVHPDFKSHTGGNMTYGRRSPISMSRKQKLKTRSSTKAELVGPDDLSVLILWTQLFMQCQGSYDIDKNILYQDNKGTILLEQNGKCSLGPRTQALNIRYFFLTDQIEKEI
jgi:hypothetical protein